MNANEMSSASVKAAFGAAGLRVRVRDLGVKFRVCPVDALPFDQGAVRAVATGLGLTDPLGRGNGLFNGRCEFIGYKPGAVVRL